SEFIATFGLLSVILSCARRRPSVVPFAVGAYITAAYWFTASTSFANPAVTLARSASDTFAGIRPADVPAFVVAQLAGASAATGLFRWLDPTKSEPRPERAPEEDLHEDRDLCVCAQRRSFADGRCVVRRARGPGTSASGVGGHGARGARASGGARGDARS